MAEAERHDLTDLLRSLVRTDWDAQSLCEEWTVRDVVAHIYSYEEINWAGLAALGARSRMNVDRMNHRAMRPLRGLPVEDLLAYACAHQRPQGLTALMGGKIALTDALIHHQDIRRALGLPREIPMERLHVALDTALGAPTLPARRKVRGLRLVATDQDWVHGTGTDVTGTSEALLMLIAGRRAVVGEVEGLPDHLRNRLPN